MECDVCQYSNIGKNKKKSFCGGFMVLTGIIIQARSDSNRLPHKVIQNILNKPVITHVIERCKRLKNCDKVVLATTRREIDNYLASVSIGSGIEVYRGEANDVLTRYY